MEYIFAGINMTAQQRVLLYKRYKKKGDIFPDLLKLLDTYGVDQFLPAMQQWTQQARQSYPEWSDHQVLICLATAKGAISKEDITRYRSLRAVARKADVPDYFFNEYLLFALMATPAPTHDETPETVADTTTDESEDLTDDNN